MVPVEELGTENVLYNCKKKPPDSLDVDHIIITGIIKTSIQLLRLRKRFLYNITVRHFLCYFNKPLKYQDNGATGEKENDISKKSAGKKDDGGLIIEAGSRRWKIKDEL